MSLELLMEGSEADPTAVNVPGNAVAPVVPKTLAESSLPLGATSATACC